MNLSIKDIIKTTGLSKKEIEELKNSWKYDNIVTDVTIFLSRW